MPTGHTRPTATNHHTRCTPTQPHHDEKGSLHPCACVIPELHYTPVTQVDRLVTYIKRSIRDSPMDGVCMLPSPTCANSSTVAIDLNIN